MQDVVTVTQEGPADLAKLPTVGTRSDEQAEAVLSKLRPELAELHGTLWARKDAAVLVLLQGMDTSGKDGTIRAVFSGLWPQALEVSAFVEPTPLESRHDFLWRHHARTPPNGVVGVFNRSWYEAVLVERVEGLVPAATWQARYGQIDAFEAILAANGVHLLKVMLHVSSEKQGQRLADRRKDPAKHWKDNPRDLEKHRKYADYLAAYQDAVNSSRAVPWHIVPADHKPSRHAAVASLLHKTLTEAVA